MIDMIPHVADRCMVANGLEKVHGPTNERLLIHRENWKQDPENVSEGDTYMVQSTKNWLTGKEQLVRMPLGEFEIRLTEFQDPKDAGSRIFAGYFFIANGRLTPNPGGVRILAYKPTDKFAYYCKVQFTVTGSSEFGPEQFSEVVTDFFSPMLTDLMRCLPDWVDIQSIDSPQYPVDPL
jgi:hypothetical protein